MRFVQPGLWGTLLIPSSVSVLDFPWASILPSPSSFCTLDLTFSLILHMQHVQSLLFGLLPSWCSLSPEWMIFRAMDLSWRGLGQELWALWEYMSIRYFLHIILQWSLTQNLSLKRSLRSMSGFFLLALACTVGRLFSLISWPQRLFLNPESPCCWQVHFLKAQHR